MTSTISRREMLKNWKGKGKRAPVKVAVVDPPVTFTTANNVSKVLQNKSSNVVSSVKAEKGKPEKPWLKGKKAQAQKPVNSSIPKPFKTSFASKPARTSKPVSFKPAKAASKRVIHQSFVGNGGGSFGGYENAPPPAPARSGPTVRTVRTESPHVKGGMMMMFSPPSQIDERVITKEKYEADRVSYAARNDRVEQMKSDGLLMNFSPPKRVQALEKARAEARPKKPIFGMTFTPGGTLQNGGMDMDNTPEELRRMRERIRQQEMKERGETENEHTEEMEGEADLAAYLGDDMEAEISIDPGTPSASSTSSSVPPTFVEGVEIGTPVASTQKYKVVQVIDTEMADELEVAQAGLNKTTEDLASAEGRNEELSEALREAKEENESLVGANANLTKRMHELEEDDLNLEKASAELNAELDALRRENESLRDGEAEKKALKKQVEGLKKLVMDLTATSKDKEAKGSETVSSLRAVNASLKKQISDWKTKVGSLQKAKDDSSKEDLVKAGKALAKAKEENLAANSTIAALETRVSTLDANIVVFETNLKGTQKQLSELKAKEGAVEDKFTSKLNSKKSTIELLESKTKAIQTKLDAECKKNLALQAKCNNEVNARTGEKQKLSKLMEQVNSYSNKSEELVSALAGEKDGNKLMKRKLDQAIKDKEAAMERVRTFDEREMELVRKLNFMDEVRKKLHNRVLQLTGNIRVFVRVRPALMPEQETMNALVVKGRGAPRPEIPFKFFDVCEGAEGIDNTKRLLEVQEPWKDRGGLNPRRKKWKFGFDSVFGPDEGQSEVWEAAEPLVQSAIDGHSVTFFAYGQTGSGKTHTMLGTEECKGLIFRSIDKIFEAKLAMENPKEGGWKVNLMVEMSEIHNEKVNDLLAKVGEGKDLQLKDNEVVGSTTVRVGDVNDVRKVLGIAQARRCTKATNMNDVSSRSHMIFKVIIDAVHKMDEGLNRHGVLHICDLAGSERLSKSKSNENKDLLKETQCINGSLHALSNVIEKLQKNEEHVPFRDSKLTYMLQNSLGGDSKTLAIICCSPLPSSFHESVCSLRFANKVNKVELQKLSSFDA